MLEGMTTSIVTVYTCDLCGTEVDAGTLTPLTVGHVRVDVGAECQAEPISRVLAIAASFTQPPPAPDIVT